MKINPVGTFPLNPAAENRTQPADQQFKQLLDKAVASKEDKQLQEAAKIFESLFIYQMFSKMRETVEKGGLFEESLSEKVFQGMFDQEVSTKAADNSTLGLAEMIYQQFKTK